MLSAPRALLGGRGRGLRALIPRLVRGLHALLGRLRGLLHVALRHLCGRTQRLLVERQRRVELLGVGVGRLLQKRFDGFLLALALIS